MFSPHARTVISLRVLPLRPLFPIIGVKQSRPIDPSPLSAALFALTNHQEQAEVESRLRHDIRSISERQEAMLREQIRDLRAENNGLTMRLSKSFISLPFLSSSLSSFRPNGFL